MVNEKCILVTEPIHPDAVKLLEDAGLVIVGDTSQDNKNKIEAIIVRLRQIDKGLLNDLKKLKVVVRHGVGVDNIDVDEASKSGILVARVPDANSISVAEYVLTAIGALSKEFASYDKAVKSGRFAIRGSLLGRDVNGLTLGIIGLGRIGKLVAEKAHLAYNMKIVGYDQYVKNTDGLPQGAILVGSIEELLNLSDFVTLHVPLLPETKNMIDSKRITLMKNGACIINASRGGVINEQDLADAIVSGKIRGAVIDVFENEPPLPDNPLSKLDQVIMTPHIAGYNSDASRRLSMASAECVISTLSGSPPEAMIVNLKEVKAEN